jgi:PleD family two-component response regulator
MAGRSFYENDSTVFTPDAFAFVMDSELKRALRVQSYLTLIVMDISREWEGMVVSTDEGTLHEVATVVANDVRGTDLLGRTEQSTLALLLLDTDLEQARRVIDRMVARLGDYSFRTVLRVVVGAACYPQHGTDAASLTREAMARPLVNWRRSDATGPAQN